MCACALLFEGFFEGKFILTIKKILTLPTLFFVLLSLWIIASGLYSENTKSWADICSRKMPLWLLPIGMVQYSRLTKKQLWGILLFFSTVITFFAFASTLNYIQHYTQINQCLLESKSVPVWPNTDCHFPEGGGITHIYFGILMSFSIITCAYFLLKEKSNVLFKNDRIVFAIMGTTNLLLIHLLSARTGLVALYGGLGVFALHTIWQYRKKKWLWAVFILLPLLPITAYFVIPSFQNKMTNTWRDLEIREQGGDINHRSFLMRLEAWKTGIDLIEKHPLTGVGVGDLSNEMAWQYDRNKSTLWPENRVMPHNQFIENAVQMGLGYVVLLLLTIFWPIINYKKTNALQWAIALMFLFAMCFESLLERQIGVTLFPLAYFLAGYINYYPKEVIKN